MNERHHARALSLEIVNLIAIIVQKLGPWALAIALVIVIRDAALSLSGQDTVAGAWIELTSRLKVSRGFAFIFGGLGFVYGIQQRTLRRNEVRKLARRIAEIESAALGAGPQE